MAAFWSVTVILILLQIVLYFVATSYAETVPELHLERSELQESQLQLSEMLEDSDRHIGWLESANRIAVFWTTFQGLIAAIGPEDDEGFREACRIAIMPMIDAAGTLFEFEFGEVWSVVVYRFNEEKELLEPMWWRRTEDHPS